MVIGNISEEFFLLLRQCAQWQAHKRLPSALITWLEKINEQIRELAAN
jgi:hypothetical protein